MSTQQNFTFTTFTRQWNIQRIEGRKDIGKHDDDDNAMNLMLGAFTYYTHTHDHV